MKKLTWIISISFSFVTIFASLLYFSFNLDFYKSHSGQTQITSSTISDTQNIYNFLQNKTALNYNFTSLEKSHLQDVKNIFSIAYYIFWISLSWFIIITLYFILSKNYNQIFKWLFIWSIISLSIIWILLFATIFDFSSSFQVFHKIFFPQWNREFAESSRLITLFPESFFIAISRTIFITISVISLFAMLTSFLIKKNTSFKGYF